MLFDIYGAEFTGFVAYSTLGALFLVYLVRFFFLARNCLLGAFPEANLAAIQFSSFIL